MDPGHREVRVGFDAFGRRNEERPTVHVRKRADQRSDSVRGAGDDYGIGVGASALQLMRQPDRRGELDRGMATVKMLAFEPRYRLGIPRPEPDLLSDPLQMDR